MGVAQNKGGARNKGGTSLCQGVMVAVAVERGGSSDVRGFVNITRFL